MYIVYMYSFYIWYLHIVYVFVLYRYNIDAAYIEYSKDIDFCILTVDRGSTQKWFTLKFRSLLKTPCIHRGVFPRKQIGVWNPLAAPKPKKWGWDPWDQKETGRRALI